MTDITPHQNQDESVSNGHQLCCTFAVTGPRTFLQAIYVCRTCSSDSSQAHICVCQACAETCHANHEGLAYIGVGMAYCDCSTSLLDSCRLKDISKQAASGMSGPLCQVVASDSFVQQVHFIPQLGDNSSASERLVQQATELVKHTKETHWIGAHGDTERCELEQLASCIFQQHVQQHKLPVNENAGAEWWVQVKKSSVPVSNDESRLDATPNAAIDEAIDLHYDKDEDLAERFGLGSFPTISTVTYLTCPPNAAPTLVFSHTYDKDDDDVINEMLVSHARRGKHLAFDGRLLHGAPSHYALRPLENKQEESDEMLRVTFLVNIWLSHRPLGIQPLSSEIRQKVCLRPNDKDDDTLYSFQRRCIELVDLADENTLPTSIRGRIELPFVSKGATWIDEEDEQDGLVLVTFPPPIHESDTVQVRFGPGLQAYLDQERITEGDGGAIKKEVGSQECYV